jgi:hypothetical protein
MDPHLFYRAFDCQPDEFTPIPEDRQGKIYVDLPHRYFGDLESLKAYVKKLRDMGANVLLILPHFLPSFSEYVVKNYEQPCSLFGSWEAFAEFMAYVKELGMDRMIDIPFNHADWQADHLKREWYQNHWENGIEAGADDTDADGNRVRINWGAFLLDNGNAELLQYWLEKIIYPHVADYSVNAIRIDAAWGLDRNGLSTIVQKTKKRYPHVWFLAENLGMARLIELADSGLNAGAERYFNNFYWYSGGRYIPADIYRFQKRSGHKPTCTIYSSHDVLMPAMRALAWSRPDELGVLNDKALHRKVVEWDRLTNLGQLSIEERDQVVRLMKLDFVLAAFLSTDLMWVAGSERCLIERVNVLDSSPHHFSRGTTTEMPGFMTAILRARASHELFNSDGVIIPFGEWERGSIGLRAYVKVVGEHCCLVAVNTDLYNTRVCAVPQRLKDAARVFELTMFGVSRGPGQILKSDVTLQPGQALVLYN